MSTTYTVKDTAARVGLPSRTLRYYDRIGLVCPPRTAAGYRVYGPEEEGRLRFVRQAKALGLSLEQIRELMTAVEGGETPDASSLLDDQIAVIDLQVTELGAFRERLSALRAGGTCDRSGHAFCACANGASAPDDGGRAGPAPAV